MSILEKLFPDGPVEAHQMNLYDRFYKSDLPSFLIGPLEYDVSTQMMNIDKVSEFLKGEEEWVESGKNRIVVFYTGKRHGYGQDSNVVWDIGRAYEPDAIKNKYIAFIRYQRIDFGDEDE